MDRELARRSSEVASMVNTKVSAGALESASTNTEIARWALEAVRSTDTIVDGGALVSVSTNSAVTSAVLTNSAVASAVLTVALVRHVSRDVPSILVMEVAAIV